MKFSITVRGMLFSWVICAVFSDSFACSTSSLFAFIMASMSSRGKEPKSRDVDDKEEMLESVLVKVLLELGVDIDCPDAAKLSDVVRSDDFVIVVLCAFEAFSVPSAGENSSDVGAALLDEAEASLGVPEAWNVDA